MTKYNFILLIISTLTLMTSLNMMNLNMFVSMNINLINFSSYSISISFLLDWISCMFLSIVMFISSMILLFSMYYIPKKEMPMFSLLLTMFVLSMAILIISNNIFLMLLGWDGLGLSSYILVVYYQNYSTAASGSITLLSNRMGDILILMSISMLLISKNWNFDMNEEFTLLPLLMLLMAACSKSAQFPFSAWLPMAMAAPTPISALVHSSTLVTAGVFLMLRLLNNIHPITMIILMIISSMTTIYASLSACWEQDLKKIIALSTLSQIAMMMFAMSMNTINLAFSHLIIHALFKSMMFLCAGIIIHESSYQDSRMTGMNMMSTPLVASILGISSMSLMALPFTSGFFSKDVIIENMIQSKMKCLLTLMMMSSIGMTMFYSMRMCINSNKMLMKSNTTNSNHFSIFYGTSITIMALITITIGPTMMWLINPEQTLLFPNSFKKIIIFTIIITFIMPLMMSYKSKNYMTLGKPALSLWFNHMMATHPTISMYPTMSLFNKNDKTWQEMYGPNMAHHMISMLTKKIDMNKYTIMTLMMLLLLIPSIMLL